MDGADMLDRLLADTSKQEKERFLKIKRDTYRKDYLRLGRPFAGVRGLFAASAAQAISAAAMTASLYPANGACRANSRNSVSLPRCR